MSQAAQNTSIEGIFNLDKFEEKKLGELMTRIHVIEDDIEKAEQDLESLRYKFAGEQKELEEQKAEA